MKPFFTKEQTKSEVITKIPLSCASCGLSKKAKKGRIPPWGKFGKKILLISDAPSQVDDRRQKSWSDDQGDALKDVFKKAGINLFRDTMTTYACICPIPKDKAPEEKEILCCRRKVLALIKREKPKLIFLLGHGAVQSIIGRSWKKGLGTMERWRGFIIPDQEHGTWICPISHPRYIETRDIWKKFNLAEVIWLQDIKRALTKLDEKVIIRDDTQAIVHIKSDKQFKKIIPILLKSQMISFDYETTGLKPHAKGHVITTTSACVSPTLSFSWMNNPYRDRLFKTVLESEKVKKSVHNLSFEDSWSYAIIGALVQNWFWDSMLNAHIIDNRKGITGLKFQTYVNFGVADYDSQINPFLQSDTDIDGANSFNHILKFIKQYGAFPVRQYCGLDSLYGYRLTLLQMDLISKGV